MFFWLVNIFIFALYSFVLCRNSKKSNAFLFVAILHLGMIMILRSTRVGTDTGHYSQAFWRIIQTGSAGRHVMTTAPVFYEYMKFVAHIFPYRNGYIVFTALPTMLCLYYFVEKQSSNYFETLFLYCAFYFYFYSMNVARQFLATGLIMVCYCLMQDGQKKGGWALWVIACIIHSSAVFFGIYIIADFVQWNRRKVKVALIGIVIGLFLILNIMQIFVKIYPQYEYITVNLQANNLTSQGRSSMVYAAYSLLAIVIEWLGMLYDEGRVTIKMKGRCLIGKTIGWGNEKLSCQKSFELIILAFTSGCIFLIYPTFIVFWRMAYTGFLFIILLLPHALGRIQYARNVFKLVIYIPILIMMLMMIEGNYSAVRDYSFFGCNLK